MTFRGTLPPTGVPDRVDHRPGSVVAAAGCFCLAALLLVAQLGQVIFDLTVLGSLTRQAGAATGATPGEISAEVSGARVFDVVAMLVVLALAASLAVCAAGFFSGRDRARLGALTAGGVVLLCCSVGVVGSVVGGRYQADTSEFQRQLTQLQDARTPDWINWSTLAALGVYPLLIAGMVLLLVSPSRRYFRPLAEYYVIPLSPPA